LLGEALRLELAFFEGRLVEVARNEETEVTSVETEESSASNESSESEIGELGEDNQPPSEIDNCETEVYENTFSDDIIFNPTTTQKTIEFLSNELQVVVENIKYLSRKQVKEAEKLVAQIIDFCNVQPVGEQWNTLAQIIRRNSKVLMIVIGCSGKEHKDWFFNLPQLLANAALDNPEELEWVDKRLRSEALLLIANSTVFS
jgi:hypothetical protein